MNLICGPKALINCSGWKRELRGRTEILIISRGDNGLIELRLTLWRIFVFDSVSGATDLNIHLHIRYSYIKERSKNNSPATKSSVRKVQLLKSY